MSRQHVYAFRGSAHWGWFLAAAGVFSGCTAPEESPWFSPHWEQQLEEAARDVPDLPDTPRFESDQALTASALAFEGDGLLELSLEDATLLALRYNRDLAVQQLNPVIAGTFETIERGVFDPEAFLGFQYAEETASETDRGTGAQFDVESRDIEAEAGVRQSLPSGTDIEMSVTQGRDASNRAPEQQTARLGLTVTQQLLEDAGPAVNLVSIRQAQLETRASLYELEAFAETLLADVETAYWAVVLSTEEVRIVEESLAFSRQQLDDVEQRIELGALASADAAVARTEVALREQALIDAKSELQRQKLRLLFLVNPGGDVRLDRPLRLVSPADFELRPLDDLAARVTLAEQSRPDLSEARLRLEQDRLETIATRNGVLPRLEVFIALGRSGFGDRFDESFDDLNGESYDFTAGVAFSKFLGDDADRGANQRAYVSRQQSAAAVENLRQLVALDVRLAATEIERSRQQVAASALTLEYQQDTVQAERDRYEAGASTALLVAQAQRDLLEAQIGEVEAVVAYRLAWVDLYLAEGTLLERRGCSLIAGDPEIY